MHAYLLIGSEAETSQKAILLAKKFKARLIEFPLQKIQDARELSRFLNMAPNTKTAVLIKNINKATNEAANAFLKNLEEKQSFLFLLTSSNAAQALPTIVSRCEVIEAGTKKSSGSTEIVEEFLNSNTADRIKFFDKYKTREEALDIIDSFLINGEYLLKSDYNQGFILEFLKSAIQAKKKLLANTNVSLQLTNFAVSLDD